MKHVLFLQDLGLSPEETRRLLHKATSPVSCEPLWIESAAPVDLAEVEIVVTSKHQVGRTQLEPLRKAKMVSMAFTGYDEVDLHYCRKRKLHLYYVPDYSTDSVAELTVAMALALLRRVPLAHRRVVAGRWDRADLEETPILPGCELRGRTVGIIGTGAIGMRAAEIFHLGFGCPVIGWTRNPKADFSRLGGRYCDTISAVFQEADVVSLHLQLVEGETVHTADAERIALLREDSILLNTARTGLVDVEALAVALKERRLWGAGLDLTEEHHLREDLRGLDNVVLTPHLGFRTGEALRRLAEAAIDNVGRFLRNEPSGRRILPSAP